MREISLASLQLTLGPGDQILSSGREGVFILLLTETSDLRELYSLQKDKCKYRKVPGHQSALEVYDKID